MSALVVDRVGPQALVVDRGRPGWAHIGVPTAGALDGPALALANRLVGNPADAAGVEVLLGGFAVRTATATTVAVAGPPGALHVEVDGRRTRTAGTHTTVHLRGGDVLALPAPISGLRHYLAVTGGIDAEVVLGSRSADTLSGLGPAPLRPGDRLTVGPPPAGPAGPAGPVGASVVGDHLVIPIALGPRDEWIDDAATALRATLWTVAPTGDRVGVRLDAAADRLLVRAPSVADRELPSEGLVLGAVQVPPDGHPIVFLADHPTTGGYPVVGVVGEEALPAFAQARPGSTVRFVPRRVS